MAEGSPNRPDCRRHTGLVLALFLISACYENLFGNRPARQRAGGEHGKDGDEGELLELRVAEPGTEGSDKVDRSDAVAQKVAKSRKPAVCF